MKNALIFLGGAAVGGLAATLYFKRKMVILEEDYQRITNDEINKYISQPIWVKDVVVETANAIGVGYSHGDKDIQIISDKGYVSDIDMSNDKDEYLEIVKKYNGQEENTYDEDNYEEDEDEQIAPYIITPDEYGEDEHTTRTLTVFTDKVILDEDNCIFDANYFGKDIIKTLYATKNIDTSLFVRDDNEKVDYEIIKEKISFEDFTKLTDSEDK